MYDTNMLKDLETKFQSAALAELVADPKCMLGLGSNLKTWRVVDTMLRAEKAAYDEQYKKRLQQFEVVVPSITLEKSGVNWLLIGTICGIGGLIAYKVFKGASSATPAGAAMSFASKAGEELKKREDRKEKKEKAKEREEEPNKVRSDSRLTRKGSNAGKFKVLIEGVA